MNTLWSTKYAIWRLIPLQAHLSSPFKLHNLGSKAKINLIYCGERLAQLPKIGIDVQSDSIVNAEFNQFFVNLKHSRDIRSRRRSYLGTAQQRGIHSWPWFLKAYWRCALSHQRIYDFKTQKIILNLRACSTSLSTYLQLNQRASWATIFFTLLGLGLLLKLVLTSAILSIYDFPVRKSNPLFLKIMRLLKKEWNASDLTCWWWWWI